MKLALARSQEKHNGFMICDMDSETTYMYIDGNSSKHVPVALLSIDPHVVYGMSHPVTINRIFSDGPQTLLTTKKLAHTLYEHGMKSSWGSMMLGPTPVFTQLSTFYNAITVPFNNNIFVASVHTCEEDKAYLKIAHDNKIYVISPTGIKPSIDEPMEKFINLGMILDYVLLEPNE